jgi:hypothetical protein
MALDDSPLRRATGPREELGMAKRRKVLPARKPRDRSRDEDSVLLRSAVSLGRVIGTLQRELEGANTRLSGTADDTTRKGARVRKATRPK